MTESKRHRLRELLRKPLGVHDERVLSKLCEDLESKYPEDVKYALEEPEAGVKDLLQDIEEKGWLEYYWLKVPRAPKRKEFVEIELDERERGHAEALRHYLVRQAAMLPEVQQFRDEKLRGDLLTPEQAENFLRAEELKDRSEEELSSYAGYVYGLDREELKELVIPSHPRGGYFGEEDRYYGEEWGFVWFRDDNKAIGLGDLSLYLASVYPWEPEDAAWFVLTGEPPEVVSVRLSYHPRRGVFSLTFAPWISERTLRQVYRKARDRTHGGKANRYPGRKALAVLRFVSERTPPGKKPKWTELMENWNIECRDSEYPPKWKFKDVSAFRKTYLRSEQRVAT